MAQQRTPKIISNLFFDFQENIILNKWTAKCRVCSATLSDQKGTTSNFRKHLKRKHESVLSDLDFGRKRRNRRKVAVKKETENNINTEHLEDGNVTLEALPSSLSSHPSEESIESVLNRYHPEDLQLNANSMTEITVDPPLELLKPFSVPSKLLLGPGPSNCPPQVLEICSQPLLGHLHPEFLQIMEETKAGIKYAFQTTNALTFAISGTGHCAMEAALCNILEPGEVGLFVVNGHWGERAADIASRHSAKVEKINVPLGEICSLAELEKNIEKYKPSLLFVCHGESSTGALHPLEGIGDICHRHNCLFVVDTVASLGGVPIFTDRWKIDVIYSGSQKVLGAPPGMSPMSYSPRAVQKIKSRKTPVHSYYMDALLLGNYWNCDNTTPGYHHTAPISTVYALREALSLLVKEKLESYWERHMHCAEMLHEGLEDLGLELFVEEKEFRLPTVTTIKVPKGVVWQDVTTHIMKKYGIEISGGLGPTAGKVWRIGLMGYNCKPENVHFVLGALKKSFYINQNKL